MKKNMTTDEIRKAFLDFFKSKEHSVLPSDSLVPQNDPSLLFTGAGMNQFKDYFLGVKKDLKRAATSQKCLRTGDLDEVGRTPYHHSFFEMLGNFSFGDYFKKEAIAWAWEFLTQTLGIPKERLRVTIHEKDDEAFAIWRNAIGLPEDWIYRCGDKSNFWPSNAPKDGPNGPCGPCSEIYFDQNPKIRGTPIDDSGKYAEIWNLVFTQFDRQDGGKLVPLKNKNIDTGMGLERLACVLQGRSSNFEIDSFESINTAVWTAIASGHTGIDLEDEKKYSCSLDKKQLYPISDHLRAVVFAINDGVVPSNEGRGYVIRKLIRRSVWLAHQLDPDWKNRKPFLYTAVRGVIETMKSAYPDLEDNENMIRETIEAEEKRFLETLDVGVTILNVCLKELKKEGEEVIPAKKVFELYDTYGFPGELTSQIANDNGFKIDQKGFEKLMTEQRKRSKESTKISTEIFSKSDLEKIPANIPATDFLGYDTLESQAKILWFQADNKKATVILDQTPFYAESGGQVGDRGILESKNLVLKVLDTQKLDKYFLHQVEIAQGSLKDGLTVNAIVDPDFRANVMRNHTATHLLHAALRKTLGTSVRQLGSMVAADRFRFDYSFGRALTFEELRTIENIANEQILKDLQVQKEVKNIEAAKKEGALAFFGDKYGSSVRMISIPDFSKELCGGTHCNSTGQIGLLLITSESSVASGVRRIEAVTGTGALRYVQTMQDQLSEIAKTLKVGVADVPTRVIKLMENAKKQKAQSSPCSSSDIDIPQLLAEAKKSGSCSVIVKMMPDLDIQEVRNISDLLKKIDQKLVYILATAQNQKLHVVAGISQPLKKSSFDMKTLFDRLSKLLDVSGGGRPDFVQGGGPSPEKFTTAVSQVEQLIAGYIAEKGI